MLKIITTNRYDYHSILYQSMLGKFSIYRKSFFHVLNQKYTDLMMV